MLLPSRPNKTVLAIAAHLTLILACVLALGPFVLMLGKSLSLFSVDYPGPVWSWTGVARLDNWRLLWQESIVGVDGSTSWGCARISSDVAWFYLQGLLLAACCTPLVLRISRNPRMTPRFALTCILILLAALPLQTIAHGLLAETLAPEIKKHAANLSLLPRFGLTLLFSLTLVGPLMTAGGLYVRTTLQTTLNRRTLFLLLLWCACSLTVLLPLAQLIQPAGSASMHLLIGVQCYTHVNSRSWDAFAAFALMSALPAALLGCWLFQRGLLEQLVHTAVEQTFKSLSWPAASRAYAPKNHR